MGIKYFCDKCGDEYYSDEDLLEMPYDDITYCFNDPYYDLLRQKLLCKQCYDEYHRLRLNFDKKFFGDK